MWSNYLSGQSKTPARWRFCIQFPYENECFSVSHFHLTAVNIIFNNKLLICSMISKNITHVALLNVIIFIITRTKFHYTYQSFHGTETPWEFRRITLYSHNSHYPIAAVILYFYFTLASFFLSCFLFYYFRSAFFQYHAISNGITFSFLPKMKVWIPLIIRLEEIPW